MAFAAQFTTIGQYAMVAANATVVKDVPPLVKFIPGKVPGLNVYAIRKHDLPLCAKNLAGVREEPFYRQLLDDWDEARLRW